MQKMRKFMTLLIVSITMVSNIATAFATDGVGGLPKSVSDDDKCPIVAGANIPARPVKPGEGETAKSLTKNPDQPDIYTLRTDYKVERVDADGKSSYEINYQPYIASVGEFATKEEKDRISKTITLPEFSGYYIPKDDAGNKIKNYNINYDMIVKKAKDGKISGDKEIGLRYEGNQEFLYHGKENEVTVKHVFQDILDLNKYTNLGGDDQKEITTKQKGNTASILEIKPLDEEDRKGFVPEQDSIKIQVPNDTKDFVVEYRYNRARFDVVFDTQGGTPLPARTLYYGQEIPKIANEDIPTKVGGTFQGWKSSVNLKKKDGTTITAGTLISEKDLNSGFMMPAEKVTFTAVWKDKDKADYAVQFWAEKADHAEDASLADKYEYVGAHVYKEQDTGSRPDLDNVSIKDVVFPNLDKARLEKIWADENLNFGRNSYLNKFFVYNQDLTDKENKDPKTNVTKTVSTTGKTVYNIYYDRQVYDLYFTKSNVANSSFYPEIWKNDEKVGEEGNPYHFKARFNQKMVGLWPDDVKEVKGFTEGNSSIGWLPNLKKPKVIYRDTPPYRLSANLFIDSPELIAQGGYVSEIDLGNGKKKQASMTDLSFGIDQNQNTMPHHIDFWLDGFDGKDTIDYDLYTIKSDTAHMEYKGFLPPDLQGFTPKKTGGRGSEFKDDGDLEDLNDEREEVTPFPDVYSKELDENGDPKQKGKLYFMRNFPGDEKEFEQNGYLKFEYSRNKYPLRFNYDPSTIKGDNEFGPTNSIDTFYEFPLKALSPDADTEESYKTENPKNLLDNPEKLQELGLTDLVFTDTDGKLKVKRPEGLSEDMVFKGWALDPEGTKLIWENPGEKMPNHALNLYAKWGEPDYKWKVTFDPDGGKLDPIDEATITTTRKTIKEGDIGDKKEITYAKKEANEDDKQIFTVVQRQTLVEPQKPTKKGYDFLGWEIIRYKKDDKGHYTTEKDTQRAEDYINEYKVPELYAFGNDVVSPLYLKAIWVPNQRVDVKVEHYFLDGEFNLDENRKPNPEVVTLEGKRAGNMASAIATKKNKKYILASHDELGKKLTGELKKQYEEYNARMHANNSFYQNLRVELEKIVDPKTGEMVDNPKAENNVFKFFYIPIRTREYKVNYVDVSYKGSADEKKGAIIPQETVVNGNRDFDARNYKKIPGWALTSDPQQQLFFDVNEETNELKGINGTGKKEITFYYRDVRIIEVSGKENPPDGYVRVTFKAGENGKLEEGDKAKTVYYDVVKGLEFSNIPVPDTMEYHSDKTGVEIVPNEGYQFVGWERQGDSTKGLLNEADQVCDNYTFVAKFEKPQGKLTIKKVLENQPVEKQSTMTRMAVPDPLKFKFKVTGPKINGSKNNEPTEYTEVFELAAGETKVLENLFDGDYKVEEIENHGYTPSYIEGDYDKTSSKLSADPIKVKLEKTDNKKDYEKTLTVVNRNVKPGEAETPNKNMIDITVKKVWKGGKKPATTIELWRKGYKAEYKEDLTDGEKSKALINEKVGAFTTTPEGDKEQTHIFKDLPKHDPSGREFEYYVKEENVPENYTNKITGSMDKGFTVTNTYQKIDVEANKVWKGDLKEGETRPTIYFKLYRKIKDGEEIEVQDQKVKKLENGITKVTWNDLDRFDENGNEFIYSVKEVKENGSDFTPEGYTKKEDGLTVTNTKDTVVPPTPEPSVPIDITVKKIWDGGKKPATTIELWRKGQGLDGTAIDEKAEGIEDFITIDGGDDEQSHIFKNLPKHDPSGREFEYYVKEKNVPDNYTNKITGSMDKGFTVTNTYQKVDVEANKVWKGDLKEGETRPTIYFKLYRKIKDGEKIEVQNQEVKKLENGTTKVTWNDLDRFDENGNEFIYSVKEVKENGSDFTPEGYTKKEDGLTVTNTKDTVVPPTPDPKPEPDPIVPGGDDTPSTPDKPEESDEPEIPDESENPKPEKPQTDTKMVSNVKNSLLPATGTITNYKIYIVLIAALSVGLFFIREEKKNKDED